MQKCVIVDYQDFFPITEAFERLGYRVVRSAAQLSDGELANCELALFCMFKAIKRPLQAWRTTQRLNAAGVPVITWNRDGPSHKGDKAWRLWALRHFRFFNIYATHTLQDAQGFAPQDRLLAQCGMGYRVSPRRGSAGNAARALPLPIRRVFLWPCFRGALPRDAQARSLLSATRPPLVRARHSFMRSRIVRLSFEEQRRLIQTSRINLNYHAGCDDNYHGGNEQGREKAGACLSAASACRHAAGSCSATTRKHAADGFTADTEWVDFGDLDDCIRKIRHYLSHFSASRAIAEAAHVRVMREHTYVHRARTLVAAAQRWREQGAAPHWRVKSTPGASRAGDDRAKPSGTE